MLLGFSFFFFYLFSANILCSFWCFVIDICSLQVFSNWYILPFNKMFYLKCWSFQQSVSKCKKIKKKKIISFKVMKMNGINVIPPYSFFLTTKYSSQSYPNQLQYGIHWSHTMPYSHTNAVFLHRWDMFRLGRGLLSGYSSEYSYCGVYSLCGCSVSIRFCCEVDSRGLCFLGFNFWSPPCLVLDCVVNTI